MRLIGMMDSPYVRRVAVSMKMMGIPFVHEQISVFRHMEAFAAVNPVIKAPTLITDDGVMLMDSTLILQHVERFVPAERRLTPGDLSDHARSLSIIGLALAACEKTVQIAYEINLRPEEKRHQPWLERVEDQLAKAYALLEDRVDTGQSWLIGPRPMQADVTTAVAWRFTRHMLKDAVPAAKHPNLVRFSERAEALPEFTSSPLE